MANWRLLIYTVPSTPSRKRAFVWRELKKAGAVYLRDGVCALPDREDTSGIVAGIAAKIEEFAGEAIVVPGVELDAKRAQAIVDEARREREQEYAAVVGEAEGLLRHIRRETRHRDFTSAELEELEADLGKLRGWLAQIQARDYFGAPPAAEAAALIDRCEHALAALPSEARA